MGEEEQEIIEQSQEGAERRVEMIAEKKEAETGLPRMSNFLWNVARALGIILLALFLILEMQITNTLRGSDESTGRLLDINRKSVEMTKKIIALGGDPKESIKTAQIALDKIKDQYNVQVHLDSISRESHALTLDSVNIVEIMTAMGREGAGTAESSMSSLEESKVMTDASYTISRIMLRYSQEMKAISEEMNPISDRAVKRMKDLLGIKD